MQAISQRISRDLREIEDEATFVVLLSPLRGLGEVRLDDALLAQVDEDVLGGLFQVRALYLAYREILQMAPGQLAPPTIVEKVQAAPALSGALLPTGDQTMDPGLPAPLVALPLIPGGGEEPRGVENDSRQYKRHPIPSQGDLLAGGAERGANDLSRSPPALVDPCNPLDHNEPMAVPVSSQPPVERVRSPLEPTHHLPEGAWTPEELAVMDQIDPVDSEAALAWMLGEGPDPWPERSR